MSLSILILLFFSLYTGEHIFYIGLGIIISIIIFAAITNIWVLFDFKYLQEISPRKADKGQKAVLTILIHNDNLSFINYKSGICCRNQSDRRVREQILSICSIRGSSEEFLCEPGPLSAWNSSVEVADIFGLFTLHMTKNITTICRFYRLPQSSLRFLPLL